MNNISDETAQLLAAAVLYAIIKSLRKIMNW